MNKHITGFLFFILCLFLLFFAGCSESVGRNDNPNEPNLNTGTFVRFINENVFSVIIYSDSARQVKTTEVSAVNQSGLISVSPDLNGAHFYPTYQIIFEGLSLAYNGDEIIKRIDENKTTLIIIRSLREMGEASPNIQLTSNSYIKIHNNGSLSLTLKKGPIEERLEGTNSPLLNGGETGIYKILPGSVSEYSLGNNTFVSVPFPSDIIEFNAAMLYTFAFNGSSLAFLSQSLLTLGEAGKISGSGDGTEASPILLSANIWINGNIAPEERLVWYSFFVISGNTYYVWINDLLEGDHTKTANIGVSAYYSDGFAAFANENDAWFYPVTFQAGSTGIIKLKVLGYTTGTYGIVYNDTGIRP